MKKILLSLALLASTLWSGEIKVAMAANVSYASDELIAEFNKLSPDTKVKITLGSSGKLTAQIKNGAPYDIFMSANMKYPASLYDDKIAVTSPVIYAQGALALLSTKKLDLSKGVAIVGDAKVAKVAVANPKTAPYGKAALEALENAGINITPKLVYAESISQTVAYAISAADIGFIAKSSLYDSKMKEYKEGIDWVPVDPKLYKPIDQGIVILKNAEQNSEAKAFYDFILSPKAKEIFARYGYILP